MDETTETTEQVQPESTAEVESEVSAEPQTESSTESTTEAPTSGKKYRIVYSRSKCIGATACVDVDEGRWFMDEDGLATLKDSGKLDSNTVFDDQEDVWFLDVPEDQKELCIEAAQGCPVDVIAVIDPETGERLDQ